MDGLVLRDRDTDANGTLDERLYSLQDANWNTTALVNTSGTVQERYTYTPFGQVTFRDSSGSALSNSAKDWVFLHQGGEKIAAGDYEFRNRIYSPSLGRWLSNDPLGFEAGDQNWYRAIGNNPGNGLDPSGLEEFDFLKNPISQMSPDEFRDWLVGQPGTPINFPPFRKPFNDPSIFDDWVKLPEEASIGIKVDTKVWATVGLGPLLSPEIIGAIEEWSNLIPGQGNWPGLIAGGAPVTGTFRPGENNLAITIGNPQPGRVGEAGLGGKFVGPWFEFDIGAKYDWINDITGANTGIGIRPFPSIGFQGELIFIDRPGNSHSVGGKAGVVWSPGEFQPFPGIFPWSITPELSTGIEGGNGKPIRPLLEIEFKY